MAIRDEYEVIWQTETKDAICVRIAEGDDEEDIWLPKSQIDTPAREPVRGQACTVGVPEWLALKVGLS